MNVESEISSSGAANLPDLRRPRKAAEAPEAALIGSALTFSDQTLRILNLEFADISFRRYADPEKVLEASQDRFLVVLDYAASDRPIELVRRFRQELPSAQIALAYTSIEHAPDLVDGSRMRAIVPPVSLLPMNVRLDVLLSVIRLLLCGEDYIPREIIHAWHMNDPLPRTVPAGKRASRRSPETDVSLTAREMEILPLIAEGKQNKAIADALGLSEHTVKLHTHNILQKLRVSNRTSAADWYRSLEQSHARNS